jgi:hypothetical protein
VPRRFLQNFRGHIAHRSDPRIPRLPALAFLHQRGSNPEVGDLGHPILAEDRIPRLDVAMDLTVLMDMVETTDSSLNPDEKEWRMMS